MKNKPLSDFIFPNLETQPHANYMEKILLAKRLKEAVSNLREDLRAIIFEIAQEWGGSVLHYNDKIDESFNKRIGEF